MRKKLFTACLLMICLFCPVVYAEMPGPVQPLARPVTSLLGEKLYYDISFLWFKRIAQGEITLEAAGEGVYLATLKAKTRGVAAFFTGNRVETFTTLMEEGPGGLLRPIRQTTDTKRTKSGKETHRQTSLAYDFQNHQVTYRKVVNDVEEVKRQIAIDSTEPIYDFLTAFYNLRLGRLGSLDVGHEIELSAFTKKGPEEILIRRLNKDDQKKLKIPGDLSLCKVLLSPEIFKTKARDVYVGFDHDLKPQVAVVKNVIGLGDVCGKLTKAELPVH